MLTPIIMYQEDWLLYHKVTFDGINKLIIINPNEQQISVKEDIFSSWKEWTRLRDNAKFLPAVRTIGGDNIGNGQKAGDTYFTINGWRILTSDSCTITGIVYSEDFPSPFISPANVKIVTNSVSNIVQSLGFSGTINVDNTGAAKEVWDYLMSEANIPGSVGERLGKLLTVAKYLGLK